MFYSHIIKLFYSLNIHPVHNEGLHHAYYFFIQCFMGSLVSRRVFLVLTSVTFLLCMARFGLSGAHRLQADDRREPGEGVQEQQLLQQHESWAGAHRQGEEVYLRFNIRHRHLQHLLLPPATLGFHENLPKPHTEPTGVFVPGIHPYYSPHHQYRNMMNLKPSVVLLLLQWTYCHINYKINNRAHL